MSNTVIQVENLSKKYMIFNEKQESYKTLRDVIANRVKFIPTKLRGKENSQPSYEEFWALQDVSFEVKQGERVGIIGRNGAGKSTLLKILSRITEPTRGRVNVKGRVASLLEVGTGFHGELTGRENIFLNGAILGMSKGEIKKKFDEIVAFAEVEKFLDTPVKRYSSGMSVRLGFAVAAHLEQEILIVDEVLAVGDAAFQKKCLGKMNDVAENEGRTVFFVSHNMAAINKLCYNVIWLERGNVKMAGTRKDVISLYLTNDTQSSGECIWEQGIANPGVREFKFKAVRIRNNWGHITNIIDSRESFKIEIEYKIVEPLPSCQIHIIVTTKEGITVFSSHENLDHNDDKKKEVGSFVAQCKIPGGLLNENSFFITVYAGIPRIKSLANIENIIVFNIKNIDNQQKSSGIISPYLEWTTSQSVR